MQFHGLRLGLLLLMAVSAPLASAAVADYRLPPAVPPAPLPPTPAPPLPPVPPCTFMGFVLDCTPGGTWASVGLPAWASAYQTQAATWAGAAGAWGTAGMTSWATSVPPAVVADEFPFSGAGTSATITIDDAALPDSDVVFVVKLGPADWWICKHTCTVPDTSFTVSVNPLDVPPSVWLGFESAFPLPNLPATLGTLTVTFA